MTRHFALDSEQLDCSRPDLSASLPRWTELAAPRRAELETHAKACTTCGPSLTLLGTAESWLEDQLLATAGDACPSAEDLFSFGRGPGAEALPDARHAELAAHVGTCAHCETLVGSLVGQPPSPLVIDPPAPEPEREPARRPHSLRLVGAGAAAAASIAAALFVFGGTGTEAPSISYPPATLLRGELDSPLHFPRERVLAADTGGLFSELLFELAERDGATGYRVYIESHTGGAFDRGERVATLRGEEPVLPLPAEVRAGLTPGHYTWEAWAVVNGLDEPLGRRDFEVVLDPSAVARIDRLADKGEPERSEKTLELLHRNYPSDARAFARTLPTSPEREAYLARVPGR